MSDLAVRWIFGVLAPLKVFYKDIIFFSRHAIAVRKHFLFSRRINILS